MIAYGVYGIMILGNFIFYLLKGDYRVEGFWDLEVTFLAFLALKSSQAYAAMISDDVGPSLSGACPTFCQGIFQQR